MSNLSLPSKLLKGMETSSSIGMFARDTGGCLISKLAVSRSSDEAKEIGFAETAESALFYFTAPALSKIFSNIYANKYNISKENISQPLNTVKNVTGEQIKNIKLAKFGQIASTFSIILPFVFAIAPLRNLLTYEQSGKDEFVSVVGLKENKKENNKKESEKKAASLIKKLTAAGLAGIGITAGILSGAKNEKFYNKIQPALTKFVKKLDFSKNGDLKLAHYGALIYPVSIASYFYASRDKYERQENARRFSVTVPLLFFGERIIEKPIYKHFDRVFNTKVLENGRTKTYEEILKLPDKIQKQYLKSKNLSYGLTFLTNTMAIAAAIGILNRIATKKQYQRENKTQA